MAGRIQGITVEIGGDTTKLQTALKGVNTEIRNTQSQLKDVDKLLKLDPGNTELLAQKHRLLGDAVKETKEKLETLKTAAEQAEQALKDGTITQDQYDGLQREIVETEQKLKSLEEQAKQSGTALQNIAAKGEKLKTVGDNISNVGTKLLPVTAGVVGLGTAAVKTAADFDSAMSKVAAVSGATGKDLNALRDKAREMGSKTKFSASEAAEAMNYMAMAGWKTEDIRKYGAMDAVFGQEQYAQIPMAVVGIVMKFFQIVISIVVGMAAGCIPVVGYNMGAGLKERVRRLFSLLLIAEASVGAVALVIVEIFPRELIGIFGATNESIYYTEFAIKAFRIYLCMMIFACVNKA